MNVETDLGTIVAKSHRHPDRLVVKRSTEQIILPENHATLGNSGVCQISESETWITCAEGRVSYGKRKGEANNVFIAQITLALMAWT
jgi:hypothetical protein